MATTFVLLLLRFSLDPVIGFVDVITHLQTRLHPLPVLAGKICNLRSNLIHLKL